MDPLQPAMSCELHVHTGGCFTADDLLELGADIFDKVDWAVFVADYERAYGERLDVPALFRAALADGDDARAAFKRTYVYGDADGGDFLRFQAKFNMLFALYRYDRDVMGREERWIGRMLDRHRGEGVTDVEYRALYKSGDLSDAGAFLRFHALHADMMRQASAAHGVDYRYIVSIPRDRAVEGYTLVRRLMAERPELAATIVGVDFCFIEEGHPPKLIEPMMRQLQRDNAANPSQALQVVYHVGESFFDKSLESAVRWCHEAALLGVRRLGHAIALGLDPRVAIERRPQHAGAHRVEPVSERLDQIAYDLRHAQALVSRGVPVDVAALAAERNALTALNPSDSIDRPYDDARLAAIRARQDFVLAELARLGVAIETCPTSNLRIGAVPSPADHPVQRFLAANVPLAVCADDPGVFDVTLADEVEWVAAHGGMDRKALAQRLGDPRRLRLKRATAD